MHRFLQRIKPLWTPHPGQLEFLLNTSKFKVLACGRRWGKTDACAVQILAALHRPYPTKHLILAPTADQATIVFERAVQLLDALSELETPGSEPGDHGGRAKVKRTPYPHLRYGSHTVMARSGQLPRALRGNEATHIVVDEAAYLPESLVTEVAMPMLATTDGYLTLISTPHGKNHFWRFFEMGQRGENGVWSRQAPSSESPFVPQGFLEIQREMISERAFQVEYESQFVDSSGQVFKTEAVQGCMVAQLPEVSGPYSIGVDWARYSDYTAVAVLSGHQDEAVLVDLDRFHGLSWSEAVRRVADMVELYQPARVACDATGVGDPAVELLQKALPEVLIEGVAFSSPVKAGLIDTLSWMVDRQALAMTPHPQLLRELEHFEATTTVAGKTKLEARGGYHDDLVIALALAARNLDKQYRPQIMVGNQRAFSTTTGNDKPRC